MSFLQQLKYLPASHLAKAGEHNQLEGDNAADRIPRQAKDEHAAGALAEGGLCPAVRDALAAGYVQGCKGQGLAWLHPHLHSPHVMFSIMMRYSLWPAEGIGVDMLGGKVLLPTDVGRKIRCMYQVRPAREAHSRESGSDDA